MAAFIQQVAAKVRHGPLLLVERARRLSLLRASPTCYRPYSRSLMTVKSVPDCRKQHVGAERFEQVLASTRNEANMLLRIPCHLDDCCTNLFSKDSDISTTAVWKNASMSATSMCDVRKIACASSTVLAELTRYSVSSIVWRTSKTNGSSSTIRTWNR